eukprot:1159289-Pelagomonas_calceolata.AAC.3
MDPITFLQSRHSRTTASFLGKPIAAPIVQSAAPPAPVVGRAAAPLAVALMAAASAYLLLMPCRARRMPAIFKHVSVFVVIDISKGCSTSMPSSTGRTLAHLHMHGAQQRCPAAPVGHKSNCTHAFLCPLIASKVGLSLPLAGRNMKWP